MSFISVESGILGRTRLSKLGVPTQGRPDCSNVYSITKTWIGSWICGHGATRTKKSMMCSGRDNLTQKSSVW